MIVGRRMRCGPWVAVRCPACLRVMFPRTPRERFTAACRCGRRFDVVVAGEA